MARGARRQERKGRTQASKEARRIVAMRNTFTDLMTRQAGRLAGKRKTFGAGLAAVHGQSLSVLRDERKAGKAAQ